MANRKKELYKPGAMTEGKRNIIRGLLKECSVGSAADTQGSLEGSARDRQVNDGAIDRRHEKPAQSDSEAGREEECSQTMKRGTAIGMPSVRFSSSRICTTNAVEGPSAACRRLNSQRAFPGDTALLKEFHLSTSETAKGWTVSIHNRSKVYGEPAIMHDGWLPD